MKLEIVEKCSKTLERWCMNDNVEIEPFAHANDMHGSHNDLAPFHIFFFILENHNSIRSWFRTIQLMMLMMMMMFKLELFFILVGSIFIFWHLTVGSHLFHTYSIRADRKLWCIQVAVECWLASVCDNVTELDRNLCALPVNCGRHEIRAPGHSTIGNAGGPLFASNRSGSTRSDNRQCVEGRRLCVCWQRENISRLATNALHI